jgi:hypothetical protein
MIIVLLLVAIAGTLLGIWLKRRHNRKHSNHNRDTILAAETATRDLQNKHPTTSMSSVGVQPPTWDGSVLMSGGNSHSREAISRSATPADRIMAESSVTETDSGVARSGSKLKKTRSKRNRRSR